jgi:hypothetical protein
VKFILKIMSEQEKEEIIIMALVILFIVYLIKILV